MRIRCALNSLLGSCVKRPIASLVDSWIACNNSHTIFSLEYLCQHFSVEVVNSAIAYIKHQRNLHLLSAVNQMVNYL